MSSKKKLLVLTGAGASVDFGMPNVNDVSKILSDATRDRFPLLFDQSRGLFEYFEDQLAEHWRLRGRLLPRERPTFEDVLLAIFETAGALDDKGFASPSTAFLSVRPIPDLGLDRSSRVVADDNVIRQFGAIAVDSLLDEFRRRCLNAERDRPANFAALRGLVSALAEKFELSFATLNYDDVLYRCTNRLETGFDCDGRFDNLCLFHRENWGVLLHLHGSVHFDFRDDNSRFDGFGGFEDVHWVEDLESTSGQNAFGSGPGAGKALAKFPRSVLVAGLGKEVQIQKQPFRTYFAEFDRLVASADALLVVGYGWMDTHVNLAFEHFRDERRRPVVAIEYARDDVWNARTPVGSGGHAAIHRLLGVMKNPYGAMSLIPQTVAGLKETREFELSRDPDKPLAIWYGGFLEACRHPDKIVRRLLSPA
jgi:SIR2-like domain